MIPVWDYARAKGRSNRLARGLRNLNELSVTAKGAYQSDEPCLNGAASLLFSIFLPAKNRSALPVQSSAEPFSDWMTFAAPMHIAQQQAGLLRGFEA